MTSPGSDAIISAGFSLCVSTPHKARPECWRGHRPHSIRERWAGRRHGLPLEWLLPREGVAKSFGPIGWRVRITVSKILRTGEETIREREGRNEEEILVEFVKGGRCALDGRGGGEAVVG